MRILELLLLPLLGVVVGVSLTSQAGINSQLRSWLGSPFQAAFVSFLVGTVLLGGIVAAFTKWAPVKALSAAPHWIWIGGLLGAFNISMSIYLVPRLGGLAMVAAIVCGQVLAGMAFDHFGLLGFPRIPVTMWRILGGILLIGGLLLTLKKQA